MAVKPKAKIRKTDSARKLRCRVMESQVPSMLEIRVELVMINNSPAAHLLLCRDKI